jgi:hypothetical protein
MPAYGIDQDADDVNDGTSADPDDIAAWMAQRQQDVANRDQNIAAGQNAWVASTASGDNLQAQNPDDVRALGADAQGQDAAAAPIKRGDKAILPDDTKARILMREFRSYSGPGAMQAIVNGAHALMNADETYGPDRIKYAKSGQPVATIPPAEEAGFRRMQDALAVAKAQRAQGFDPTGGALHFGFQTSDTRAPWLGEFPIHTQVGPLHNSFTYGDVPSSTAWANTYRE